MFGKDNYVFWVKLTRDEFEQAKKKPLVKRVRLGKNAWYLQSLCIVGCLFIFNMFVVLVVPEEDLVAFRDDFNEYILTVSTGELYIPLYATE